MSTTHIFSMPVNISIQTVKMLDPELRGPDKSDILKARQSEKVTLPTPWSRKTLRSPLHYPHDRSLASLATHRKATPYYPYCEELYNFALKLSCCNWLHVVSEHNFSSDLTYNFPCGCADPTITQINDDDFAPYRLRQTTSAIMTPKLDTTSEYYEVPSCRAPPSSPRKNRKRKPLSLTDCKSYRRLLRSRRSYTYSSQLTQEEEDSDE